ncbi:MAG: peptidase M20, partial [Brevundimonas sp.]|nr:peptidase M20 [Brevundimonas sp.]
MRLLWLVGSLALALLIAVLTLQVPAPVGTDAPDTDFSTERAMVDVREIARRPHPVGSAEHDRVQAVLMRRMADLGLQTSSQAGALSPAAVRR